MTTDNREQAQEFEPTDDHQRSDRLWSSLERNAWAGGNLLRGEVPRLVLVDSDAFGDITAQEAYHRWFFLVPGGTGATDAVYICIKNAADAYEFMNVQEVTLPTSRVTKQADEIVNNSTTLQDDDELLYALSANTSYTFTALITYTSGTTPDYKFAFTVPAGASIFVGASYINASASGQVNGVTGSGSSISAGGLGTSSLTSAWIWGQVNTAGTAGNLQFQFAQNTADVSDTTTKAGSWLAVSTA